MVTSLFFVLAFCTVGYGHVDVSNSNGKCNAAGSMCGPYPFSMKQPSSVRVNVSSLVDRKVRSGNTTLTVTMNSSSTDVLWLGLLFFPFGSNPAENTSNSCNLIVTNTSESDVDICKVVTLRESCSSIREGECRVLNERNASTHFKADCHKNGTAVDIQIYTCQHTVSKNSTYGIPFNVTWWPFMEGEFYAAAVGGKKKLTGKQLFNCPALSSKYNRIELIPHELDKPYEKPYVKTNVVVIGLAVGISLAVIFVASGLTYWWYRSRERRRLTTLRNEMNEEDGSLL